jgi:hypothetical protein
MATAVQSVSELAVRVAQDPSLREQIKSDPAATIASLAAPLQFDVWIYRMVVGALGLTVVIAIIGAVVLKSSTVVIWSGYIDQAGTMPRCLANNCAKTWSTLTPRDNWS